MKKNRNRQIFVSRCKDISEMNKNVDITEICFFEQYIKNDNYIIDAFFDNISKYWFIRMNKIIYNGNKEAVDLVYEKFNLKSPQLSLYDNWFDI